MPDRLAWTTIAQTLYASTCSQPLTVETRNALNQPTAVLAPTLITFSSSAFGLAFFLDPLCATSTVNTTLLPGSSSATVYFRATQAGSPALTASATGLTSALQIATVLSLPTSLVFLTLPPVGSVAGSCFLATVEARTTTGPAVLISDAAVSLQASPGGGLRFYSNATCSNSIGGTTIPAGQSRASFYVKPISGGVNTLTATASFGSANLTFPVVGVVRRGQCILSGLQTNCPISPPQAATSRTMLVYQGTASTGDAVDSEVRCRLQQADLISCQRNSTPTNNATITWQTAELLTGLTVQRDFAPTCSPTPYTLPLSPGVNASSAFVLSSLSGMGANFDDDDLTAARLTQDGGALLMDNSTVQFCNGYEYQVVELSGVTTLRGGTGALTVGQRQLLVPVPPAVSLNTVLFHQAVQRAVTFPSTTSICNLLVRSSMPTATQLAFSRGADNASTGRCSEAELSEFSWERVDFGTRARVQSRTITTSNNSVDVAILAVDTTRTLVFSGGQMAGGQATGETAVDNAGDDALGPGMARFELINATTVRLTRGRNQSSGAFTFYVVELEP